MIELVCYTWNDVALGGLGASIEHKSTSFRCWINKYQAQLTLFRKLILKYRSSLFFYLNLPYDSCVIWWLIHTVFFMFLNDQIYMLAWKWGEGNVYQSIKQVTKAHYVLSRCGTIVTCCYVTWHGRRTPWVLYGLRRHYEKRPWLRCDCLHEINKNTGGLHSLSMYVAIYFDLDQLSVVALYKSWSLDISGIDRLYRYFQCVMQHYFV